MEKFVCLAAGLSGDNMTAALLPMAAEAGDRGLQAAMGRAEVECGGGFLQGFGSTLIRVIITTGTHTHPLCLWYLLLASVLTPVVFPGQR